MRIHGRATLAAPPEAVFAAVCDPAALLEVIPGCEELQQVSVGQYRGRIVIRLPAIVGRFETAVRLLETEPSRGATLEGSVTGRAGAVVGRARFRLAPDGAGTAIEYDGEGTVTGPLARLDGRFVEGLVESLVREGLSELDRRLAAQPVVAR